MIQPKLHISPTKLTSLDDETLLQNLISLREKERKCCVRILDYLIELEYRKSFLELGFSSLFDFCRHRLHYSESGANRRIRSARALARFPQLRPPLLNGSITLSGLSIVASLLNEKNIEHTLCKMQGATLRDIEKLRVELEPKEKSVKDRIKAIGYSKSTVQQNSNASIFDHLDPSHRTKNHSQNGGNTARNPKNTPQKQSTESIATSQNPSSANHVNDCTEKDVPQSEHVIFHCQFAADARMR